MFVETIAMLEMVSGIPSEALLGAPFAMVAGLHVMKAQSGQSEAQATELLAKGARTEQRLLSPQFVEVATLSVVFGVVVSVAAWTGWMPQLAMAR
jgi:hypothetical protein